MWPHVDPLYSTDNTIRPKQQEVDPSDPVRTMVMHQPVRLTDTVAVYGLGGVAILFGVFIAARAFTSL